MNEIVVRPEPEEWEVVYSGTRQNEDTGTYCLAKNDQQTALSVTQSLFALTYLSGRCSSHLNWVLGDIVAFSSKMHGDAYYQELDSLADLVGWSKKQLDLRERASLEYSHCDLRRFSYDERLFERSYPHAKTSGVQFPIDWAHYKELCMVDQIDTLDRITALEIAWRHAMTARQARAFARNVVKSGEHIRATFQDILKSSKEDTYEAESKIHLLKQENENRVGGKYLVMFPDAEEGVRTERHFELTPDLYDRASYVIKFTARSPREVVDYDGHSESLREIPTQDMT